MQDDVYSPASDLVPTYNGYPWVGKNHPIYIRYYNVMTGTDNYGMYWIKGGVSTVYDHVVAISPDAGAVVKEYNSSTSSSAWSSNSLTSTYQYEGTTYYYTYYGTNQSFDKTHASNYLGYVRDKGSDLTDKMLALAASAYVHGVNTVVDDDRDYVYTGGLAGVLDGAGTIENTDVVGTGTKEEEKDVTSLPWPADNRLDQVLGGVSAGEKTWSDVLDTVGAGVIDRTTTGDMVIDDDGVTEKEWTYSPAIPTTPDITIPDTAEASKELKDYTITGLESFFPFCLPFDAIAFLKVLDAPPVAPHFTIPFKYPTKDGLATYDIDIDLSPFDPAVIVLRDMECLLFIVGLIVTTRSMFIRG